MQTKTYIAIIYFGLLIGALIFVGNGADAQQVVPEHSETVLRASAALEIALQCADRTGAPILVIAGRKTCPPCRALSQQVKTDEPTKQMLSDCVKVYLDCDSPEYQQWIAIHPPTDAALPQWFLVRADGQELINRTGGVSNEELKTVLGSNLIRAGKTINESESDRVQELVVEVSQILESKDDIAAAEAIKNAIPVLKIASNNYSASSNQLRHLIRQVQSKLVRRIDSAREQLSELSELKESSRKERLIELQTLISRLRSVPSVAKRLRILESEMAEQRGSLETSVKRRP